MLIKNIKVSGLLSFGPVGIDLPLNNLNLFIGPNGSGKTTLFRAITGILGLKTGKILLSDKNRGKTMLWEE
jgi:ABC-type cobalamin/Fe3+-siderophores transport system ATPase subunit